MSVETCNAMTERMVVNRATVLPFSGKQMLQFPVCRCLKKRNRRKNFIDVFIKTISPFRYDYLTLYTIYESECKEYELDRKR